MTTIDDLGNHHDGAGKFSEKGQSAADASAFPVRKQNPHVPLIGTVELETNFYDDGLPEWPEGLAPPEATFELNSEVGIETTLWLQNGSRGIEFYRDRSGDMCDSIHDGFSVTGDDIPDWYAELSEEDQEAVIEYGRVLHDRIDNMAYGAQHASLSPEVSSAIANAAQEQANPTVPGGSSPGQIARVAGTRLNNFDAQIEALEIQRSTLAQTMVAASVREHFPSAAGIEIHATEEIDDDGYPHDFELRVIDGKDSEVDLGDAYGSLHGTIRTAFSPRTWRDLLDYDGHAAIDVEELLAER